MVLLVEDDPGVRATTGGMLRELGYDVREAETYQLLVVLALQKVQKHALSGDTTRLPEALEVLRATLPRAVRRDA